MFAWQHFLDAGDTKYVKLPSETGKIDIRRDIKELRFSEFKEYVWQAIRKQDALELGDHAEKLENNGLITWLCQNSIPHTLRTESIPQHDRFVPASACVSFSPDLAGTSSVQIIQWLASLPHGGPFAAKNKATIHNNRSFSDFIEIVSALGEEIQKNIVILIKKDPNALAQAKKESIEKFKRNT
ncbi:hypothetical protein VP01_6878g1 [Puccinia sorghi]|uniref:Uncharacterized protein n=1 Tax=Puccinia sorghi TaxID=27349 RepID=A0A0L6UGH5_9BASI|nr:hypothetical protein VP01_6878g1 [Puccinia sorghi]